MSARDNGGPAFPVYDHHGNGQQFLAGLGMTLRDYFAAKAMQAQVTTDMVPGEACDALISAAARSGQDPIYRLALNSYEIADAMLKARGNAGKCVEPECPYYGQPCTRGCACARQA